MRKIAVVVNRCEGEFVILTSPIDQRAFVVGRQLLPAAITPGVPLMLILDGTRLVSADPLQIPLYLSDDTER
jgi:hypothetical protein